MLIDDDLNPARFPGKKPKRLPWLHVGPVYPPVLVQLHSKSSVPFLEQVPPYLHGFGVQAPASFKDNWSFVFMRIVKV